MEYIYIAFVSTPGLFASMIRKALKQKYVHVAISLDEELHECYSIGRRNPEIPIFAGFEKEDKNRILNKFPNAEYKICKVNCSKEQRRMVKVILEQAMKKSFSYHYTILGLPLILFQIPFAQRKHYTCSSYIAQMLQECGIWEWEKDTSIVTPKDFLLHEGKETVFEGRLEEITYVGHQREDAGQFLYES
ncbi:MAG: hypothetical protein PHN80_04905 [Hespellia sp.]|nr:hypothetical protein [Hespellia sp.]